MSLATQGEIGANLDLSERSVRQLMADGVIPQGVRGEHDLDACRVAYIRHLREIAAGRAPAVPRVLHAGDAHEASPEGSH